MQDVVMVYVDCHGVTDKRTLAGKIANEIKDAYIERTGDGKFRDAIAKHLKAGWDKIAFRLVEMELEIGGYFRVRMGIGKKEVDAEELFESALGYADILGKTKEKRFVIIFDEFQDIGTSWKDDDIKRLRAIVQRQKHVGYIFCGSSPTFMSSLVDNRDAPFYRQLEKIRVGPLPEEAARTFIESRFHVCGYDISNEALETMLALTRCIPDYVQRLGAAAANMTKKIDNTVVSKAYEQVLLKMDSEFRNLLSSLGQRSPTYTPILIGFSRHNTIAEASRAVGYDLKKSTRQLAYLQNIGLLEKAGRGDYEITDPVFKDWLQRNFS